MKIETRNIEELVKQALLLCREQGFAEASVHSKNKIFKALIRRHSENGLSDLNEKVLEQYVKEQVLKHDNGLLVRDSMNFKIKTAMQLKELAETGTINYGKVIRKTGMTEYYFRIVKNYRVS